MYSNTINISEKQNCIAIGKLQFITSNSLGTFGTPSVMTIATFGIPLLSPLDGLNIVLVAYLRAAAVLVLSSKYLNVIITSFLTVTMNMYKSCFAVSGLELLDFIFGMYAN